MLRGFRRGIIGLFVGLLVLSPIVATITPAVANAASENPLDQLERWMYYRGMRACFDDPDFNTRIAGIGDDLERTASDINIGHIFSPFAGEEGFGYLAPDMGDTDSGSLTCSDGSIFVRGATLFGFDNTLALVCAMNRALPSGESDRIQPSHPTDCEKSTEVKFKGGGGSVFQEALTKALESEGSKDRPAFNINDNNNTTEYSYKALLYLIGKKSLEVFCGDGVTLADGAADGGDIGSDEIVSVDVVSPDGIVKPSQPYPIANNDRNESSEVDDIYFNQGGDRNNAQDLKCSEMATMTRDNSAAYAAWAINNKDEAGNNENQTKPEDESAGGGGTDTTSCGIDGIGWIICPVMTFMGTLNDTAFDFLTKLLAIKPSLIQDPATLKAWSAFRDIANVAFVIAFMVIVYSQITSMGISNYGLKKMLPKIVVAAILVNISYFVCALMVDLSNIAGSSLYSLLSNLATDAASEAGDDGSTWSGIIGGLLIAGAGALLLVAIFLAPTVLIALAVVVLILVARQALVIILLIVSPLAFVAYLLPNTESWFKKWWKAFVATLMVYPIVAIVFGASTLVSNILMGVAGDGGGGDDEQLMKIVALAVLAIPLFAIPAILKGSLAAIGSVGTKISGFADRSQASAGKQARTKAGQTAFARGLASRKQNKEQYRTNQFANAVAGNDKSMMGRMRRRAAMGVTGRTLTKSGEYAQNNLSASAQVAADKNYEEQVRGAGLGLVNMTNADVAKIGSSGMINGRKATEHELAAANDRIMKTGSFDERREALEYLASNKADKDHGAASLRNRAVQGSYSRGDANIYGAGFGNEIVSETGKIDGAEGLMKETVENAAAGKVSEEHTVQGEASSKYLVRAVTDVTHGDATAQSKVKTAAAKAKTGPQTSAKYTSAMDSHYSTL